VQKPVQYAATPARAVLAGLLGSLTGGCAFALAYFAQALLRGPAEDHNPLVMLPVTVIGMLVCMFGFLLASPFWFFLHRAHVRKWWAATTLGGCLPILIFALMLVVFSALHRVGTLGELHGRTIFVILAVPIVGALVGFVTWRASYRPSISAIQDVF
jgi:hypothetical protein